MEVIEATKSKLEVELALHPNNRRAILYHMKQENHALAWKIREWILQAEARMDLLRLEIDGLHARLKLRNNTIDQDLREILTELTKGLIVVYKSLQAQLEIDELEELERQKQPVRPLHLPPRPQASDGDS
jgi:hypothetical protein